MPPPKKKGVAIRLPISGTMAELFLQYIENKHKTKRGFQKHNFLYRYVDEMLIIYDITSEALKNYVNHIHSSLQLNPTYKNNAQINFLEFPLSHRSDRQP
jgi:disulfide oxidoreductase YuzD